MNIFEITLKSTHTTLVESVCKDLTAPQRRIVEGVVSELRPLFEDPLTQDKIDQIFSQVEQEVTAAGSNRSGIGKTVDATKAAGSAVGSAVGAAAGAVNNAINGLGQYLQTTAPVKYFDDEFDKLKQKISVKLGADSNTMAAIDKLGQYARANPGKTAFAIGTLTAIAAFTTGPAGGAIAGQVLRGATELLKGEKLSTAVGKGFKSAAFGYLTGSVLDSIGNWFRTWTINMVQYTPDIRQAKFGWSEKISWGDAANGGSQTIARSLDSGYFLNADADRLSQLAKTFNSTGNPTAKLQAWDEFRKLLAKCAEPEYFERAKITDQIDRALAISNDKLYQNTVKLTKSIAAAAQGAVQAQTGAAKAPATPAPAAAAPAAAAPANFNQVRENHFRLTNYEVREIFAVAGSLLNEGPMDWARNITTKITADKLNKLWDKEGKPMDSGHIAVILRRAQVNDKVIAAAFKAVEAPLPSFISKDAAVQSTTDATTDATTNATGTTQDQGADVFGNMAQTMKTMQPPGATSTGGSVAQTPTGLKHTAKTDRSTAQPTAVPDAAQPTADVSQSTKYKSPQDVVNAIASTIPKDWLPEITAELLKRQQVGKNKR